MSELDEKIEPAPWARDAWFIVSTYGDGKGTTLVHGWQALCDEVERCHYHEPNAEQRAEVLDWLCDWDEWESAGLGASRAPWRRVFAYEDGSVCVERVTSTPAYLSVVPVSAPVGWKLVPVEPTREMIEAADDLCPIARGTESHRLAGGVVPEDYYRAMLSASPPVSHQVGEGTAGGEDV
jgi:hypothetical protein